MRGLKLVAAFAASAAMVLFGASAQAQTKIKLEKVVGAINTPLAMVQPKGDNRMFIIEQNGRVKILENGKLRDNNFLGLRRRTKQHQCC